MWLCACLVKGWGGIGVRRHGRVRSATWSAVERLASTLLVFECSGDAWLNIYIYIYMQLTNQDTQPLTDTS